MKNSICTVTGVIGSLIAGWFGGFDVGLQTLLIFMAIDFVSGLIVATVFHTSNKTETGRAESKVSFKGLCRKCMILFFVLIGHRLDLMIGATYIRDGICIAFIINECISITENAALMGIPMPAVLTNAIDLLKKKSGQYENKEENKND